MLSFLDYSIVGLFLFLSVFIAHILSKKKNTGSVSDYFQSSGSLSWFIAGTGMVATTFAADTPLAVTELVAESGISGNWLWWYGSIGSVVTIYFFAPLWKNSGVTTDLELVQLRYSGISSKILRIFKSIYLGIFLNILIISWVNLAMVKIVTVLMPDSNYQIVVGLLLLFGFLYTSLMGLTGITYTDTFQFLFAMAGCIWLSVEVLSMPQVNGIEGIKSSIPIQKLSFLPNFSSSSKMNFPQFLVMILVVWWSSWYPGAEPGGGGYIAQRILATKDVRSSMLSTLWFTIAHYFIRPWPWILVALASMILFPELSVKDKGKGYVQAITLLNTTGLKGFMLATFMAAYLSTIATHLNWGASYITNDLIQPYLLPNKKDNFYLQLSKLVQLLSGIVSLAISFYWIETISGVWKFLLAGSAGMGVVLILRWFWWRINGWSEVSSLLFPPFFYALFLYGFKMDMDAPLTYLLLVLLVTISTMVVTFATPPVEEKVLLNFYQRVKPLSYFWKGWLNSKGYQTVESEYQFGKALLLTLMGIVLVISGLFSIGYLIFGEYASFAYSAIAFLVAGYVTLRMFPDK